VSDNLPLVPRIAPTLLSEHRDEHRRLDIALVGAPPAAARLITRFSARTTIAAVANVRPSIRGGSGPPVLPPPRDFLAAADRERIKGVAAAYRYVDSRLAIVQLGYDQPPALRPETPYVLNALTEGRMDNPDESNPGMIRAVEFDGNLPVAPYPAPPRDRCRTLLESAVSVANSTVHPATVRAAWMLYVLGEIHPFADGNGRVARLLYLLLTGEDMPRTVDWGSIEQFRYHQDEWLPLLKVRDVGPSAAFLVELSTAGARLTQRRLSVMTDLLVEIGRQLELPAPGPELVLATWLRRSGRLDEVAADAGLGYQDGVVAAEKLANMGILERSRTQDPTTPARPSYRPAPEVKSALDRIEAELGAVPAAVESSDRGGGEIRDLEVPLT
jgi:Fic/DOC family